MMDDLIKRLADTAAQRALATANDDPNNYLLVVARISHEDSALMSEAAAALSEARAEVERLREALTPFAFYSDEPNTTQEAWEIRYRDRFKDWIDFADIEAARAALEAKHG